MNIPLLNQIIQEIRTEPRRLAMESWITSSTDAPCGTAACIAGHAVILYHHNHRPVESFADAARAFREFWGSAGHAEREARLMLGITPTQASRLFLTDNWPKRYRERYDEPAADDFTKRAEVAIARIKHFIKTKGRE